MARLDARDGAVSAEMLVLGAGGDGSAASSQLPAPRGVCVRWQRHCFFPCRDRSERFEVFSRLGVPKRMAAICRRPDRGQPQLGSGMSTPAPSPL